MPIGSKALITGRHIPAAAIVGASLAACVYLWANTGYFQTARWAGWPFIYDGIDHGRSDDVWQRHRVLNCIIFPAFFVVVTLALAIAVHVVQKSLRPAPPEPTVFRSLLCWLLTRRYSLFPLIIAAMIGSVVVAGNLMIWGWYGHTGWPLTYYYQTDVIFEGSDPVWFSAFRMSLNIAAFLVILLAVPESIQATLSSLRHMARLRLTWWRATAFGVSGAAFGGAMMSSIHLIGSIDYLFMGPSRVDDMPTILHRLLTASTAFPAIGAAVGLMGFALGGIIRWRGHRMSSPEGMVLLFAGGAAVYCGLLAVWVFVEAPVLSTMRFWLILVLLALAGGLWYRARADSC